MSSEIGYYPLFHQCTDKDLVDRLSGLKQCPDTGELYARNQWQKKEDSFKRIKNNEDENEEDEVWLSLVIP